MRHACYSCPDGNEWNAQGPTGRACPTCKGKGYLEGVSEDYDADEDDDDEAKEPTDG